MTLIGIAIAGTITSLAISRVPPSGSQKPFRLNPWAEIGEGLTRLYQERTLWLTVVGIAYFWFMGALLQMDIILLGKEVMELEDFWIGILGAFLAIGIGIGSVAAGRLSGDKVELGLVPLGSIGIGGFSILLASSTASYAQTVTALLLLGFSGGLFIVPLNAVLQQKSGREERGRVIATSNFVTTGGVLLASGVLWTLRDLFQLQADRIILVFGLFTLLGTVYILRILPDFLIRFTLWMVTHTIYRIRIVGQEHVPFLNCPVIGCLEPVDETAELAHDHFAVRISNHRKLIVPFPDTRRHRGAKQNGIHFPPGVKHGIFNNIQGNRIQLDPFERPWLGFNYFGWHECDSNIY